MTKRVFFPQRTEPGEGGEGEGTENIKGSVQIALSPLPLSQSSFLRMEKKIGNLDRGKKETPISAKTEKCKGTRLISFLSYIAFLLDFHS
jgi:hypothetical protein